MQITISLIGLLVIAACSPKSEDATVMSTSTPSSNPLESIHFMDTKPEGALAVQVARAQLKPGDEAVVFGQIGGVEEPFLDGYAGFVLGDTDIVFCDEMGDEHCLKPWDACCADPDVLKVSRASVNFVDAEGKMIAASMKDVAGLKGLAEVTIKGTVAQTSTPDNLIIEATEIYVDNND
ncbi:MAG: hypothetical protein ACPGSB_01955 [Opitutales bacterium]